jgi:hypothetical protein
VILLALAATAVFELTAFAVTAEWVMLVPDKLAAESQSAGRLLVSEVVLVAALAAALTVAHVGEDCLRNLHVRPRQRWSRHYRNASLDGIAPQ